IVWNTICNLQEYTRGLIVGSTIRRKCFIYKYFSIRIPQKVQAYILYFSFPFKVRVLHKKHPFVR
ncbi:hypothetical protein GAQ72_19065, partial [Bacteroides uniformis]